VDLAAVAAVVVVVEAVVVAEAAAATEIRSNGCQSPSLADLSKKEGSAA